MASPDRAEDYTVPLAQKGPVVEFTIPKVDVYEIAVVETE